MNIMKRKTQHQWISVSEFIVNGINQRSQDRVSPGKVVIANQSVSVSDNWEEFFYHVVRNINVLTDPEWKLTRIRKIMLVLHVLKRFLLHLKLIFTWIRVNLTHINNFSLSEWPDSKVFEEFENVLGEASWFLSFSLMQKNTNQSKNKVSFDCILKASLSNHCVKN